MAATADKTLKDRIVRELALLAGLLFIGVAIVPLAVYFVGQAVFGEYGGGGFAAFFRNLHGEFRTGDPAVWFLLLSPYLVWQLFRGTTWAVRRTGRRDAPPA